MTPCLPLYAGSITDPHIHADKGSLHHLCDMGMSHQKSVVVIYIVSALLGVAAVVMTYVSSPKALLILAVVLALIIIGARRVGITSDGTEATKVHSEKGQLTKGV